MRRAEAHSDRCTSEGTLECLPDVGGQGFDRHVLMTGLGMLGAEEVPEVGKDQISYPAMKTGMMTVGGTVLICTKLPVKNVTLSALDAICAVISASGPLKNRCSTAELRPRHRGRILTKSAEVRQRLRDPAP